jgi:hypothetical protein
MKKCAYCGSLNIYRIEFRTDGGAYARTLDAVNDGIEEIENEDLPKYLNGFYCHSCKTFCSIK